MKPVLVTEIRQDGITTLLFDAETGKDITPYNEITVDFSLIYDSYPVFPEVYRKEVTRLIEALSAYRHVDPIPDVISELEDILADIEDILNGEEESMSE